MRTFPTGRRPAVYGLTALAGLLLAVAARPAVAGEGVVRISDGKTGVVAASHTAACTDACTPGTGPSCCVPGGECDGCNSGCRCGGACDCGKGCGHGGGLMGKLFGKKSKNCRCGKNCACGKNGNGSGLRLCGAFGGGAGDPIGSGYCPRCGSHGLLYGPGMCAGCCGVLGIPCCLPGIPVPCLPLPGCFAGNGGALGGTYGRVYALNPYYHDFRDGAVYAAQGYNAPISVPLAPNVDYTMNYGWGMPSSRMTPVSRVVPSPYAVQPTYAVPPGYVQAGSVPYAYPAANAGEAADDQPKVDLKSDNGTTDPTP